MSSLMENANKEGRMLNDKEERTFDDLNQKYENLSKLVDVKEREAAKFADLAMEKFESNDFKPENRAILGECAMALANPKAAPPELRDITSNNSIVPDQNYSDMFIRRAGVSTAPGRAGVTFRNVTNKYTIPYESVPPTVNVQASELGSLALDSSGAILSHTLDFTDLEVTIKVSRHSINAVSSNINRP